MASDALRLLTTTLGFALYFGLLGSPTKGMLLPPAAVAIVSLQNEIAAETDTTETTETTDTTEGDSGSSDDSGSGDEGGGSGEEESD